MPTAAHNFHSIFLHINWHCHGDRALITRRKEGPLYESIEEHCRKLEGVHFKGIGGIETHIHLVLQVAPTIGISEIIGKLKGASAREINRRFGPKTLVWQRGFGVVSFAERNLNSVLKYVGNQKEHHRNGSINQTLEFSDDKEEAESG